MCCSKKCLKLINILFVVLLWLISVAELAEGIFLLLVTYEVNKPETIGQQYVAVPPLAMILFGIALLPLVVVACFGFCKEVSACVNIYSTILILLSFLQVAVGVFCIIHFTDKNTDLSTHIRESFTYSFRNYKNNPRFVDDVQQVLRCCGINSSTDWRNDTLPWSCCEFSDHESCKAGSNTLFTMGCYQRSIHFILYSSFIVGYCSIGFGVLEIIMAILGCYSAFRHFKNSYIM